ncbi:TPA: hypothetical protein LVM22_001189 [Klebsiella oxytoca]|nr:hypothetical protein [Klebsiella oxytoca]
MNNPSEEKRKLDDFLRELAALDQERQTIDDEADRIISPFRKQISSLDLKISQLRRDYEREFIISWGCIPDESIRTEWNCFFVDFKEGASLDLNMLFNPPYTGFCDGLLQRYFIAHSLFSPNDPPEWGIIFEIGLNSKPVEAEMAGLMAKGLSELLPYLSVDNNGDVPVLLQWRYSYKNLLSFDQDCNDDYYFESLRINAQTHNVRLILTRMDGVLDRRQLETGDIRTTLEYLFIIDSFTLEQFRELFSRAVEIKN